MLEVLAEPLEPGRVIAGAYRLERIVGQGGMGVVWAAREIATGRAVALKFLRDGEEVDRKNRERFVREARAAMTIAHPHVAKVEHVLETDVGTPFMVMELLEGESMRDLLRRRGVLAPGLAASILLSVVDAVAAAHAHRIVHRDLKPENVFLVGGNHVRVLDFGIAKRVTTAEGPTVSAGATSVESLTSTGAVIGTPVYMAPEQIFGDEDVDGRADVWSLGIMLYECLAGERPTDADGFGQIVKRITTDPIEPLDRVKPDVPKVLARLTTRMLTRDRAARPTLGEIRDVLAKVVAAADAGAAIDEAAPATVRMPPRSGATSERTAVAPNVPTAAVPVAPTMMAVPSAPKKPGVGAGVIVLALASVVGVVVTGYAARDSFVRPRRPASATTAAAVAADAGVEASVEASAPTKRDAGELSGPDPLLSTDAGDWQSASRALDYLKVARERREGALCLRYLDRYDLSHPEEPTTVPASPWADDRAKCMMLIGKCNAGRVLLRRHLELEYSKAHADKEIEDAIAEWCEGDADVISQREAAMRADFRLSAAASGSRTASTADCQKWHATLKATLPRAPKRGPEDSLTERAKDDGDRIAAQCLARAGACTEAIDLIKQRAKKEDKDDLKLWFHEQLDGTTCTF